MKFYKLILATGILFVLFSVNMIAQEKEMTKDEWQAEMNRLAAQKVTLTTDLNALKTDVANLKKQNAGIKSFDDCINELYSSLGVTKADVDNFGKQLSDLTAKVDAQTAPKADRQAELDAMKKNKIAALPEYFDKVQNLQRKLDAWQEASKEINYSVVKGDCLWNISKKKEIYANPFAWPIIYKANRDQIKNADLIFPKTEFQDSKFN